MGETISTLLDEQGRLYLLGQKLYFTPKLVEIDYSKHKIKSFCSGDRSIAIVTTDNILLAKGNFWIKNLSDIDVDTGISEIPTQEIFNNSEIIKVGGMYQGKYALIKE